MDIEISKSIGHIKFSNEQEFYIYKGDVYRCNISTPVINGYRMGRWECTIKQYERFKDVIQ